MSISFKHTILSFKEKYAGNIHFWIVLFFILRLYGITNPPLEISHNWRQVTGDMVARNFYEVDNNILYPRLDMAGEKTGISGTEFSVLNYLMYLLSLVFGFHDWFGRIINLFVSSLGVLYFYKLLKLKFDERFSFYAAFLLLTSMWLMFSRKVMPDTFSTSLVIISLFYAFSFVENRKRFHVLFYFLFATLGVLSKIPAIYLLVVLVFPLLDKNILLNQKVALVLFSLLMLVPVVWWYFYWVPYLTNHFGYPNYYMGTDFMSGLHEIVTNMSPTLEKFYFDTLKFIGFAAFLTGVYFSIVKKEKRIILISVLCSLTFRVFMLKAGRNFYHHSYYITPFVPVMCLSAAYGILQINKQWIRAMILFAITIESIADQQHDFRIKESEKYKLSLESIADKVSAKNDLIVINGGFNPQLIYFSHRKGWTISAEQTNSDSELVKEMVQNGCKFLFIDKHETPVLSSVSIPITKIYDDQNFVVYSLAAK
ncbi:MAG: ArnT family glycosyltransferase [Bacteroidia bacterium]